MRLVRFTAPGALPRVNDIALDPAVLLFAAALSLQAGLLFGAVPVLKLASPRLSSLKDGGRSASDTRNRHRTRGALVVSEIALALVLLLDQLPRNVFRGKAHAFALDSRALAIAEAALLRGHDRAMAPIRRRFLYMPFEHSESLPDQQYCVSLFEMNGDDPEGLDYARKHLAIIERFGRFPHRNEALERETTPEEEEFLKEPDSRF